MHYDLSIGRKDTQIVPCHQVPRFRQTEFSPVFNSFHSTDEDRLVVVRLNGYYCPLFCGYLNIDRVKKAELDFCSIFALFCLLGTEKNDPTEKEVCAFQVSFFICAYVNKCYTLFIVSSDKKISLGTRSDLATNISSSQFLVVDILLPLIPFLLFAITLTANKQF